MRHLCGLHPGLPARSGLGDARREDYGYDPVENRQTLGHCRLRSRCRDVSDLLPNWDWQINKKTGGQQPASFLPLLSDSMEAGPAGSYRCRIFQTILNTHCARGKTVLWG